MNPVDWAVSAAFPGWLDRAPDEFRDTSATAGRAADRLDVVRAALRSVLGESAVALGWSGMAASAAAASTAGRCDQLGALRDLVAGLSAELSAVAERLAGRRDELRRLRTREIWAPVDPLVSLWTVREIDRVLEDVRADDVAAAGRLAQLADGLQGMGRPEYAAQWIDPVAPPGSLVWLREHRVLPSAVTRDLVGSAATLPPGRVAARLRDDLFALPADELSALLETQPSIAARLAADDAVPAVLAAVLRSAPSPARIAEVKAVMAGLTEVERRSIALLYPRVIGSLDGVPVADRIAANRVLVTAALDAELADRADTLARLDRRDTHTGTVDFVIDAAGELWDRFNDVAPIQSIVDDFEGDPLARLQRSDRRIALYRSLLSDRRNVLAFDPGGDGLLVELFGTLDARTRNVAVLVPGTFMALESYEGWAGIARDFHGRDPHLATISWLGGDFPDTLSAAALQSYAERSGPALRDFMAGLDVPTSAAATVLGYSYGGAVVGVAEREGMVADRVLHVESAGAGAGVDSLVDYAGGVREHYTMTAPGDPITYVRGVDVGPFGHGGDPDAIPGFVSVPTGCFGGNDSRAGERIGGFGGHTDVFSRGSTAWESMYAVMTGRSPADIAVCRS